MTVARVRFDRSLALRAGIVFACLLLLRYLAVFNIYFYEEDEISIAAGVAALVRDNVGDLYRYTPQLGYYRFVELIDRLAGGDVSLIPSIMKGLSVFSGALIPVLGLGLFHGELSARRRWLVVLMLGINPILWKSSQYGNSGLFAACLGTLAITILSNRPARIFEAIALGIFGLSVFVRLDIVLLSPVVAFLVIRGRGSLKAAVVPGVLFMLAMLAANSAIHAFDPRIDDAGAAVATHFAAMTDHFFWEYLLWAISPIPLILAVWGFRALLDQRPWLAAAVLSWTVPTFVFYFAATSTPRYFLAVSVPLAIAAAVGIDEVAGRLKTWFGGRLAFAGVVMLASIHLFMGLGHFRGRLLGPFFGPSIVTHDRGMPTGALLYDGYLRRGFLHQSVRNPGFGKSSHPHWEGPLFTNALAELARYSGPKRTVVILLHGGWGHAFHYHAQVAGARYVSRAPSSPSAPFGSATWMEIGANSVMTVRRFSEWYDDVAKFDIAPGDQVWVMGKEPFPTAEELEKIPAGLQLTAAGRQGAQILVHDVEPISR